MPIIFISSASDNMNMVMAMNMGADDFIAKPFDQSVLMASDININNNCLIIFIMFYIKNQDRHSILDSESDYGSKYAHQ